MAVNLEHYPTLVWLASRCYRKKVGVLRLERNCHTLMTPVKIIEVLSLLYIKDIFGQPMLNHRRIIELAGVSQGQITGLVQKYRLPRRRRGFTSRMPWLNNRRPKTKVPAGLQSMYKDLQRKLGSVEARRLVSNHMRIRGIV